MSMMDDAVCQRVFNLLYKIILLYDSIILIKCYKEVRLLELVLFCHGSNWKTRFSRPQIGDLKILFCICLFIHQQLESLNKFLRHFRTQHNMNSKRQTNIVILFSELSRSRRIYIQYSYRFDIHSSLSTYMRFSVWQFFAWYVITYSHYIPLHIQ
jgi:hypothetical protein